MSREQERVRARAAAQAHALQAAPRPPEALRPPEAPTSAGPVVGPEIGAQARGGGLAPEAPAAEASPRSAPDDRVEVEDPRTGERLVVALDDVRAGQAIQRDHEARAARQAAGEEDAPSASRYVAAPALMRSITRRGLYPPGGAKRTLNVDLPADLADDLAALLRRHPGTNRTQVIRRLVEELVEGEGRKR